MTADGFQKGLKTIILERGLWRYGMNKDDALALLLHWNDFDLTKFSSILDKTVKRIGEWLYFSLNITWNSISLRCIGAIPRGRLEPNVAMSVNTC